jgi:hypothetical protein
MVSNNKVQKYVKKSLKIYMTEIGRDRERELGRQRVRKKNRERERERAGKKDKRERELGRKTRDRERERERVGKTEGSRGSRETFRERGREIQEDTGKEGKRKK